MCWWSPLLVFRCWSSTSSKILSPSSSNCYHHLHLSCYHLHPLVIIFIELLSSSSNCYHHHLPQDQDQDQVVPCPMSSPLPAFQCWSSPSPKLDHHLHPHHHRHQDQDQDQDQRWCLVQPLTNIPVPFGIRQRRPPVIGHLSSRCKRI